MDAIDEQRTLEAENPELAEKEAAKRRKLEEEGRLKIQELAEKRKAARRAALEAGLEADDDEDWNEDDYDVEFEYRP
jgi:GTP-binding protein